MFCACGPSSFTGTTRLTTRTRLSHHGFSNNHSNGRAYMKFVTSVDSNVNYNSCMLVLQCLGNDNQNRVIFRTSQAKPRCGLVYRYHSGDGWCISCLPLMDFGGNDDGDGRNDDYGGNGGRPFGGGGNSDGNEHPFVLLFLLFRLASDSPGAVILRRRVLLAVASLLGCFCWFEGGAAFARHVASLDDGVEEGKEGIWEVRGGRRARLVPNETKDEFVVSPESSASFVSLNSFPFASFWFRFRDIIIQVMLPEGFPNSVTSDYLDYSLWRGVQSIASQISSVLATQSLLYAVGLGKGAIPTAAAINWVLKDGIGYLSKIFLSKYGRHFDVHPKGWRLFADVLENGAFGLEMLTPAFPQYFVIIGAVAGAGRSAASLIQAATRSCFYAGFAAQRNFAEVIAKGEAQGMVSKSIGIMLGIALANQIGSSTPLTLASFLVLTGVHMYCNLESYKCILIRTLNPYRASLVFSEYLLSGQVPPVKEVNDEEPLFPAFPFLNMNPERNGQLAVLSADAKEAAVEIERRLQLGSKLSTIISNREDAQALFDLYRNEGYILTEHKGKYCVILKESSSPQDMLKSLFHVNYLYWLESIAGIKSRGAHDDSRPGGRLQISLEYVQREFNHAKYDGESAGWTTDVLIARPLPNRIRQVMSP